MFLGIFQVKQCLCLIFEVFHVPRHNPGPTVCISHFPEFSIFLPHSMTTVCISHFPPFQCFLSYSRSYSVCVSFSTFFSFLAILHVLQCAFLIIHIFECFSPYSRSCSVHFSFFTFFSVSRHTSRSNNVCVSFSNYFTFFAIIHVLHVYFSFSMIFNFLAILQVVHLCISHFPNF